MMTGSSLVRWSQLESRRRAQHEGGIARVPLWARCGILGTLAAVEVGRRFAAEEVLQGNRLWLAFAVGACAFAVFSGPFRLYWRSDSKLLASLPLSGTSVFSLASYRSAVFALGMGLFLALPTFAMGIVLSWELAARHLPALLIAVIGAGFAGPSAALAAGAIVASETAQAAIASMGGEVRAPKTSWLGILPGLAATAMALAVIAAGDWAVSNEAPGGIQLVCGLGLVGPAIAFVWAFLSARRVVPEALREVSALDQEILAHVERSRPSWLERAMLASLSEASRRLAIKDAVLLRRRFPGPHLLIPLGIAVSWLLAAVRPDAYLVWTGSIVGGLLGYSVILARRSLRRPTEISRLLRTLPISTEDRVRAKRRLALSRVATIALLAAGPATVRAQEWQAALGVFLGAVWVAAVLVFLGTANAGGEDTE